MKRLRNYVSDIRGRVADLENRNSLLEKQIEEYRSDQIMGKEELAKFEKDNEQLINLTKERDYLLQEKKQVMDQTSVSPSIG